jgi:transcriptional regulator
MVKRAKQAAVPTARAETARSALREALTVGPRTARQLSAMVRVRERDVEAHLEHLAQSLRREGRPLSITPPECLKCGFAFADRARFTRPSRCPQCGGERIQAASFCLPPP